MATNLVLATINARYIHTALGLRSLRANLGEQREQTRLLEFTDGSRPADLVETILACKPAAIGLGVAIWNVDALQQVVATLKRVRPDLPVVLGGPEVGWKDEPHPIEGLADVVVRGEAEVVLPELFRKLVAGESVARHIVAEPPDLATLAMPFAEYSRDDLANRIIYVETTRGCPFGCEFCLSCLDTRVRHFPMAKVLEGLERLWKQGVRRFKFVDRALQLADADSLLRFFLARPDPALFLHFEWVPNQLSDELLALLAQFPAGAVQLEAGVQTFSDAVAKRINRHQGADQVVANLTRMVRETGCHVHADLVAGLPGETVASLGQSFDRLAATGVHEIQFGVLKRLRGAPIGRHDDEWSMVYAPNAPYEVLQTSTISFPEMQRLKRFARYLDLVVNSGNFKRTLELLGGGVTFSDFDALSHWLWRHLEATGHIQLERLAVALFAYFTRRLGLSPHWVAHAMRRDWERGNRRRLPQPIAAYTERPGAAGEGERPSARPLPPRQRKHS